MKDFVQFYTGYDEETRLQKHRTEFISSTYILDKFIRSGQRILDIGAGTGTYSLYYAEKGCSVVAIDAVPKHIEILCSKLQAKPELDIQAYVTDARKLTLPLADKFDVILFMGPIYHISQQELKPCLNKCLQLLKKDGILAASYVNTYDGYEREKYADMCVFYKPSDIERLLSELNLNLIYNVPTDGEVFGELNELAEQQKEPIGKLHTWLDKNQFVLTNSQWNLNSRHVLYIGRKM
jgi:2-polyprenyl-3-methyl-5-hydroxy-6-metoxy-1,4-benzoquinol methylase